ncbi:hypothetical protein [Catenulispora subtropica]|uniref:Uncharacterized protein n=1 Tax=Catenulispora subtropica TaxID=450798 RepID=A0ABN2SNS4_9ACTN
MEWMLIEAYCAMYYGSPRSSEPQPPAESTPTEVDLWITRQAYEFATAQNTCGKCGAGFRRKLSLATAYDVYNRSDATWRIGVAARCRSWRRHRSTALVTEFRGGLQFGPLLSVS